MKKQPHGWFSERPAAARAPMERIGGLRGGSAGRLLLLALALTAIAVLSGCDLQPTRPSRKLTATASAPRPSPTRTARPTATPTPEAGALPQGRFAVGFVSQPNAGIVMEIPAFEIRGERLRVYAAFAHRGERSSEFYAPLEPGKSAELYAGDRRQRPVGMSENFEEDICPEYPRIPRKTCLWIVGAVERGWFEFEIPKDAQPPFTFRFPGFNKVELQPTSPFSGEVWGDLPAGPFPQGEWAFEAGNRFRHSSVPVDIVFRRIRADAGGLEVELQIRQPKGLLVLGQLPGPAEMGVVDAAGHQMFPVRFPEDLKEMAPPREASRIDVALRYPLPTARGPLIFRLAGWPLVRFDPEAGTLVEVDWDGRAFVLAPTPTPSPAQIARGEIAALLEQIAGAVGRSPEAFRAALDPKAEADPDLLRAVASGGGWPLRAPRLEVTGGKFEAEEARDVRVELSTSLEGFPEEERWRYPAKAEFRKTNGAWRIVRWEWESVPPWARLPGRPWTSEHFTLIAPPDLPEGTARAVLTELEEAYQNLSARLPQEIVRPRYLAVYAPDRKTFRDLTGKDAQMFLGVAFYRTVPVEADGEVVGFRTGETMIVLNAEGVKGYRATDPIGGRAAVLRHELVHVILAPWTRPWTPGWLVEGAALTYAGQPYWRQLREEIQGLGNMTYTTQFGHIGDIFGTATARQYAMASAMAEFVRERYGDSAFLALYRAYGDIPVDVVERHMPMFGMQMMIQASMDAIARESTPGFLQQHLGVDPAAFEEEFLKWWKARR